MATLERTKGRRKFKRVLLLPHYMITGDEFHKLSSSAIKLLIDIAVQYNGFNNGDLTTAWGIMEKNGWKSKGTLFKAIHELEETEFIVRTRQGGKNKCNLFAITWQSIDDCKGKLDVNPTRVASNAWKLDRLV